MTFRSFLFFLWLCFYLIQILFFQMTFFIFLRKEKKMSWIYLLFWSSHSCPFKFKQYSLIPPHTYLDRVQDIWETERQERFLANLAQLFLAECSALDFSPTLEIWQRALSVLSNHSHSSHIISAILLWNYNWINN